MSEKEKNAITNPEESAAAEKETVESTGTYTHKFAKPFSYEGKTYNELIFDWDGLTGDDSLAIETELQSLGKVVVSPEFSGHYLVRMASRACLEKIGSDVLCAMSLRDFNMIRKKARSYLLGI